MNDRKTTYILVLILVTIWGFFLLRHQCFARPPAFPRERIHEQQMNNILTIEECIEKIQFHRGEADRIYNEVKDRCWFMPNLDDRQKAHRVFSLIGPTVLVDGGIKKKSAAIFIQMAIEYGLDCMDEWDWISNKWHWVEYHTDMLDFYERYLIHGARLLFWSEE
jgi:hypothetical protein